MTLKIDIIKGAFSQLAISGVTVGASDEDNANALERLEDMAAEFDSRNICTNYNFQDSPGLNDESNVDRAFMQAFKSNLAIRLIPDFIKQVPQTLIQQANQSLSNMSARTAQVRQVEAPRRMPRGSANTLRGNRWQRYNRPVDQAPISCATNIMQEGEINDYIEHFDSYLNDCEDIDTFTITADPGLLIVSSANSFTDVTYRVEAKKASVLDNVFNMIVKITITTTDGRVEVRDINFSLK